MFALFSKATIDIYNTIVAKMLPTPTKIHYLFNLRDISRVCTTIAKLIRRELCFLCMIHGSLFLHNGTCDLFYCSQMYFGHRELRSFLL